MIAGKIATHCIYLFVDEPQTPTRYVLSITNEATLTWRVSALKAAPRYSLLYHLDFILCRLREIRHGTNLTRSLRSISLIQLCAAALRSPAIRTTAHCSRERWEGPERCDDDAQNKQIIYSIALNRSSRSCCRKALPLFRVLYRGHLCVLDVKVF